MAIILIPVIIITAIVGLAYGGSALQNVDISTGSFFDFPNLLKSDRIALPGSHPSPSPAPRPSPQPSSQIQAPPAVSLDTIITDGPQDNSVLLESNKAVYTFSGSVFPSETKGNITFETKVEGLDQNWVSTSEKSRTILLPAGSGQYTFLVRSKLQGITDATPASRTIRINISPYFGKVIISELTPTGSATISSKITDSNTILPITGWKLEGRTDSYIIPRGIEQFPIYDVARFIRTDITLKKGTNVLIRKASNPLANNAHFQPNQCFGYFSRDTQFPIGVPSVCHNPRTPTTKELSNLQPYCQNFIRNNTQGCRFPEYKSNTRITSDIACYNLLQQLEDEYDAVDTYEYCYQEKMSNANFISNVWHVYTGGEEFLRPGHDRVILRDLEGLFVHERLY